MRGVSLYCTLFCVAVVVVTGGCGPASSENTVSAVVVGEMRSLSNLIFDKRANFVVSSSAKVDFGSVPLQSQPIGRILIEHDKGVSVDKAKASCGCTVPELKLVSAGTTEMLVYLKPAGAKTLESAVTLELSDSSTRIIELKGVFVSPIAVSPQSIVFDEAGPVGLDFNLSAISFRKPVVRCLDDRFKYEIESAENGIVRGKVHPVQDLDFTDLAFAISITFAVTDTSNPDGKNYSTDVIVKRRVPRVVIPSSVTIDKNFSSPLNLLIVGNSDSTLRRTGRCRMGSAFEGSVINERHSSLRVELTAIGAQLDELAGSKEMQFEMEFEGPGGLEWRPIGKVRVLFLE